MSGYATFEVLDDGIQNGTIYAFFKTQPLQLFKLPRTRQLEEMNFLFLFSQCVLLALTLSDLLSAIFRSCLWVPIGI